MSQSGKPAKLALSHNVQKLHRHLHQSSPLIAESRYPALGLARRAKIAVVSVAQGVRLPARALRAQNGYSSLRQLRGSSGCGFGVRSSSMVK
jgi:hypothetical protein